MTSIILAGGKSLRLGLSAVPCLRATHRQATGQAGWSKALETIGGKSLIQRVVDRLATLSTEIIIVTTQGETLPFQNRGGPPSATPYLSGDTEKGGPPSATPYLSGDVRIKIVADIYPGKGPLGGIYTGLVTSSCLRAIVAGCDMPFLNIALLDYMTQLSSVVDVVVPRTRKGVEPLCAIYSKNCLVSIRRLLEHNELRISELFNMAKIKYVEEDEINRFDPEHLSFFNINTKADLDKARRLAVEKRWME